MYNKNRALRVALNELEKTNEKINMFLLGSRFKNSLLLFVLLTYCYNVSRSIFLGLNSQSVWQLSSSGARDASQCPRGQCERWRVNEKGRGLSLHFLFLAPSDPPVIF